MVIVVSSSSGGADAVGRETLADLVLIPGNMAAREIVALKYILPNRPQ